MTVKFRLTLVALIAAASAAVACAQAPEPTCPPTPQQPTSEQIQAGMRAMSARSLAVFRQSHQDS